MFNRFYNYSYLIKEIKSMKVWYTVKIWNGYSNNSKPMFGTYDQIASSLAGLPPSFIWSIE